MTIINFHLGERLPLICNDSWVYDTSKLANLQPFLVFRTQQTGNENNMQKKKMFFFFYYYSARTQ